MAINAQKIKKIKEGIHWLRQMYEIIERNEICMNKDEMRMQSKFFK